MPGAWGGAVVVAETSAVGEGPEKQAGRVQDTQTYPVRVGRVDLGDDGGALRRHVFPAGGAVRQVHHNPADGRGLLADKHRTALSLLRGPSGGPVPAMPHFRTAGGPASRGGGPG